MANTTEARAKRWQDDGACLTQNTNNFYPELGQSAKDAKETCRSCPVIDQCLDWGLKNESYGIWGGLSERQRKKIPRLRQKMEEDGLEGDVLERAIMAAIREMRRRA